MNRTPTSQPRSGRFQPFGINGTVAPMTKAARLALGAALLALAGSASGSAAPAAYDAEDKTDLLDWSLSYPAEVAAIPALAETIRADSLKQKAEYLATAKADKASRAKDGFPFFAYEQKDAVDLLGQTPRLLSLSDDWFSSTGGAHPNHGTRAMLWDKQAGKATSVAVLLAGGAGQLATLYANSFCTALDKERASRRTGVDAAPDPSDPFNQCPKLGELAIMPKGPQAGGAMTTILFHADPYVAGPYVEGDYDIELPVTPAFTAALLPDYRSSVAAQP